MNLLVHNRQRGWDHSTLLPQGLFRPLVTTAARLPLAAGPDQPQLALWSRRLWGWPTRESRGPPRLAAAYTPTPPWHPGEASFLAPPPRGRPTAAAAGPQDGLMAAAALGHSRQARAHRRHAPLPGGPRCHGSQPPPFPGYGTGSPRRVPFEPGSPRGGLGGLGLNEIRLIHGGPGRGGAAGESSGWR